MLKPKRLNLKDKKEVFNLIVFISFFITYFLPFFLEIDYFGNKKFTGIIFPFSNPGLGDIHSICFAFMLLSLMTNTFIYIFSHKNSLSAFLVVWACELSLIINYYLDGGNIAIQTFGSKAYILPGFYLITILSLCLSCFKILSIIKTRKFHNN